LYLAAVQPSGKEH